jgi:hypothetical protein
MVVVVWSIKMPMFSFNRLSFETKLLDSLQYRFFVTARRNKILAKWAGGRLGYNDSTLSKYIRNIVLTYIITPNDRKLVDCILSDFNKAGINVSEDTIHQKMKAIEERIVAKREKHAC